MREPFGPIIGTFGAIRCAVALAAAMGALAVPVNAQGVIFACATNNGNSSNVRLVDPTEPCKAHETRAQWNIVPPQGPEGSSGARGDERDTGNKNDKGDKKVKKDKEERVTGYVLGRPDAPLTIMEFTDLECPFCRQFHVATFDQLKKEYIDIGRVRYISRDYPSAMAHRLAIAAARVARCAAEQGKFWEMRHQIMINNARLKAAVFAAFAQDLNLNMDVFKACASDKKRFEAEMKKDFRDGRKVGVSGTPTFVIGRTSATGFEGVRLVGAQPYRVFDARLKGLLDKLAGNP